MCDSTRTVYFIGTHWVEKNGAAKAYADRQANLSPGVRFNVIAATIQTDKPGIVAALNGEPMILSKRKIYST